MVQEHHDRQVLSYDYNDGGHNNQKLALLGLFLESLRTRRPVILPSLFNLDQSGADRSTVPIEKAYEIERIRALFDQYGLTIIDDTPPNSSRGWDFFGIGAQHIAVETAGRRMEPYAPVCAFFRSLVPIIRSHAAVRALRPALAERCMEVLVVQMRIETDWQLFSAITLDPTVGKQEDYLPSFSDIMAKVVNTLPADFRSAYIVCDEAALPVPISEIRATCRRAFGVELLWKSDILPTNELLSLSSLERSIIDFDMALHADCFVGLTRSSFSNLVTFERYSHTRADVRRHYVYNVPGPYLLERRDNGAYAFANAATAEPS